MYEHLMHFGLNQCLCYRFVIFFNCFVQKTGSTGFPLSSHCVTPYLMKEIRRECIRPKEGSCVENQTYLGRPHGKRKICSHFIEKKKEFKLALTSRVLDLSLCCSLPLRSNVEDWWSSMSSTQQYFRNVYVPHVMVSPTLEVAKQFDCTVWQGCFFNDGDGDDAYEYLKEG